MLVACGATVRPIAHQVGVQVEGRGEMAGVVLLRWPAVHHEEPHALLKTFRSEQGRARADHAPRTLPLHVTYVTYVCYVTRDGILLADAFRQADLQRKRVRPSPAQNKKVVILHSQAITHSVIHFAEYRY